MSEQHDFVLYVISAWREASWPAFKRTVDMLYMRQRQNGSITSDSLTHFRRRTLQALDSLGHCEVEFGEGGGRIYVAPPILARLPLSGLPQAVLCGARSPQTISRLLEIGKNFGHKLATKIQIQENNCAFVPRRIAVEAELIEIISDLAKKLQIGFNEAPPAWGILHFSGSLQEYLDSRAWLSQHEINWHRRDFVPERLQFRMQPTSTSTVRLSSYDDPVRLGLIKHYLWRDGVCAEVDRDWGRYAVLREYDKHVLAYDAQRMMFIVPSNTPLPRLLAKALALCSGYAPIFLEKQQIELISPEQYGFDIFTGVPPDIAEITAAKLGQNLVEVDLKALKLTRKV